jgi:hypothetical protein
MIKALICFGLACELAPNQPDVKLLIPWFLHSVLDPKQKEEIFPNLPDSNVVSTLCNTHIA